VIKLKVKTVFGTRLRELREEANLSQRQLGEKLGTTKTTINRYENDLREPEFATLIQIVNFFGVSADYLLGIKDSRKIN
jgi:transcriptional regulator with XRE-family HTH domain